MCKTIRVLNYKELWEGHKVFNGAREIKDLFPEGHIAHGRDCKTVKEQMKSMEELSEQGILARMIKHRREERPWEFE